MSNLRNGGWMSPDAFVNAGRGRFVTDRGRGRGGRGNRGGRGGWNMQNPRREPPPMPDIVKYPLGELLHNIDVTDLIPEANHLPPAKTKISNLKYVASYNWLDSKAPTIVVPGQPPTWTPPKHPQRLKEDDGEYFRDPNGARFPSYPTEPAVRAILTQDTTFPTSTIDVFACGSTLGNLLRFIRSSGKAFRFVVEVVGNTVFFVRKENSPRELIENVRGYGHTFPDAYTTWPKEVKGSESHQRLVQYQFGGLECMVRFECDGSLESTKSGSNTNQKHVPSVITDDDLSQAFRTAAVSSAFSTIEESLTIQEGGREVPQNVIFDLKTRSGRYKTDIDMSDILPVLWLKQIPNFVVAYHDGAGLFQDIRVRNIESKVQAWEQENNVGIKSLAVLLQKIVDIARKDPKGLLEVYCPSNRLEIRRQHGGGSYCLPSSLREEWKSSSKKDTSSSDDEEGDVDSKSHGGIYLASNDGYRFSYDDDTDEEKDFTACSVETCGYCGTCSY